MINKYKYKVLSISVFSEKILNGNFKGEDVLFPSGVLTYKYMIGKNTIIFK